MCFAKCTFRIDKISVSNNLNIKAGEQLAYGKMGKIKHVNNDIISKTCQLVSPLMYNCFIKTRVYTNYRYE